MDITALLILAPAAAALVLLTARLLHTPLRIALRAALNTSLGLAALFLVNLTGSAADLTPGINFFNAAVVGVLGIPGLGLLFLIQWVLT